MDSEIIQTDDYSSGFNIALKQVTGTRKKSAENGPVSAKRRDHQLLHFALGMD